MFVAFLNFILCYKNIFYPFSNCHPDKLPSLTIGKSGQTPNLQPLAYELLIVA